LWTALLSIRFEGLNKVAAEVGSNRVLFCIPLQVHEEISFLFFLKSEDPLVRFLMNFPDCSLIFRRKVVYLEGYNLLLKWLLFKISYCLCSDVITTFLLPLRALETVHFFLFVSVVFDLKSKKSAVVPNGWSSA